MRMPFVGPRAATRSTRPSFFPLSASGSPAPVSRQIFSIRKV